MKQIGKLKFRNERGYSNNTYVGYVYDPIVDKINEIVKTLNILIRESNMQRERLNEETTEYCECSGKYNRTSKQTCFTCNKPIKQ